MKSQGIKFNKEKEYPCISLGLNLVVYSRCPLPQTLLSWACIQEGGVAVNQGPDLR